MKLTAKEHAFVCEFLKTSNATDAYRTVYGEPKPNTAWRNAYKIRHKPHVAEAIAEAQAEALKNGEVTFEGHIKKLMEIRDEAIADRNWDAAIRAEVNRGKAAGLYVTRLKHEDLPPPQIIINRPGAD